MKKIAIIRTSYLPLKINSYNVQEIGLANSLLKKGYSVDIYSKFEGVNNINIHSSLGENSIRLIPLEGYSIFGRLSFFPNLINTINKIDYCLIQVNGDSQLMTPFIVKYCSNEKNKIVVIQGVYQDSRRLMFFIEGLLNLLFKDLIIKYSTEIFVKSTLAKEYLESKKYSKLKIVPVGLNFEIPKEEFIYERQLLDFREQFDSLLLYVGIIEPRRNIEFLLEVFKETKKKFNKKIGLVIVGDGPDSPKMLETIKNENLGDDILYFKGVSQSQIWSVYQNCDIFLLASSYEIFGMVVLESLFYGLYVVSSNTAGPLDILKNPNLGTCVEMEIKRWVDVVIRACTYKDPVNKLFRKNYVMENYNWDKISENYICLDENIGSAYWGHLKS